MAWEAALGVLLHLVVDSAAPAKRKNAATSIKFPRRALIAKTEGSMAEESSGNWFVVGYAAFCRMIRIIFRNRPIAPAWMGT
jgi:hypothetical protein